MHRKMIITSLAFAGAFMLGGTSVWAYHHVNNQPATPEPFSDDMVISGPIARSSVDPFAEMQRMRERMDAAIGDDRIMTPFDQVFDKSFGSMFPSLGKVSGNTINVDVTEDDESVIYRMNLSGDAIETEVNVSDDYISIDAKIEERSDHTVSVSEVSQRFSVPANVDAASADIERKDDAVIIRFSKKVT